MKILHTISSIGVKSGGTSSAVYAMLHGIRDYNVKVLSYELANEDHLPGNNLVIDFVPANQNRFAYSSAYKKSLIQSDANIFHSHGLWQYTQYATSRVARKKGIPYIITPHGMLYPEALNHSKFQKQLFLKMFLLNDLNKATAIHVTSKEEMKHIRNLGVKTPIAIVPNPVINVVVEEQIQSKEKIRFGYLGRVHPRKNIERLLYVWSNLAEKVSDSELVVIGEGDDEYMSFLKKETERLSLKNVVFPGFLSGKEKEDTLNSLSYLAVPSDFENFGMIIPEALQLGIPVIASKGTPWEELNTHQCGWWVDNDVDTLTQIMENTLQISDEERIAMGERGKALVNKNYSVEVVTDKMTRLYDWILNKGKKPEFVFL